MIGSLIKTRLAGCFIVVATSISLFAAEEDAEWRQERFDALCRQYKDAATQHGVAAATADEKIGSLKFVPKSSRISVLEKMIKEVKGDIAVQSDAQALSISDIVRKLMDQLRGALRKKGLPEGEIEQQVLKLESDFHDKIPKSLQPRAVRKILRSVGEVPCVLADGGPNESVVREAQKIMNDYLEKRKLQNKTLMANGDALEGFAELPPASQAEIAACLKHLMK